MRPIAHGVGRHLPEYSFADPTVTPRFSFAPRKIHRVDECIKEDGQDDNDSLDGEAAREKVVWPDFTMTSE